MIIEMIIKIMAHFLKLFFVNPRLIAHVPIQWHMLYYYYYHYYYHYYYYHFHYYYDYYYYY